MPQKRYRESKVEKWLTEKKIKKIHNSINLALDGITTTLILIIILGTLIIAIYAR